MVELNPSYYTISGLQAESSGEIFWPLGLLAGGVKDHLVVRAVNITNKFCSRMVWTEGCMKEMEW
jgi:hypothetical protein